MRTTLTIDDDVLVAVRYLAEQKKVGLGKVLSDLARKGLKKQMEIKNAMIFLYLVSRKMLGLLRQSM